MARFHAAPCWLSRTWWLLLFCAPVLACGSDNCEIEETTDRTFLLQGRMRIDNSTAFASNIQTVDQCPPGFAPTSTSGGCQRCDGQVNRASTLDTCDPCPGGHVPQLDNDTCINRQDLCCEQCNECADCMDSAIPVLLDCPGMTTENGRLRNCVGLNNAVCPGFYAEMLPCMTVSPPCFLKFMCTNPCVCDSWKTGGENRCGGEHGNESMTCDEWRSQNGHAPTPKETVSKAKKERVSKAKKETVSKAKRKTPRLWATPKETASNTFPRQGNGKQVGRSETDLVHEKSRAEKSLAVTMEQRSQGVLRDAHEAAKHSLDETTENKGCPDGC